MNNVNINDFEFTLDLRKLLRQRMSNDRYIWGQGFHCTLILDLAEVKSVQRFCFWSRGWWYGVNLLDNRSIDIHVKEEIDLVKVFKEYNEQR